MALSTEKAQSSQWLPRGDGGPPAATVHPDAAPGFRDGDLAEVESEVASLTVRIRFDDRQRRDVLLVAKGGWLSRGACANVLVPARETDAGEGAVYYDTPGADRSASRRRLLILLAVFLGVLFLYGLVSARLERTVVTGPMVFTAAGMASALSLPASPDVESARHVFLTVAEVGLVLLLFADASRTDLGLLRSIRSLPLRLLSVGMLLTIGLGALAVRALLDQMNILTLLQGR